MSLEALTIGDVLRNHRARCASRPCGDVVAAVHPTGSAGGCHWIEGDDFLERLHRGEAIYSGTPVREPG
jgi:hypothetical protein